MTRNGNNLSTVCPSVKRVVTAWSLAILMLSGGALGAAAPAAEPQVFLEELTIVGAGGTLAINQLQFTTPKNKVNCNNVTIRFSVGPTGQLVVGTPDIDPCVTLQTNEFVPGTYAILSSKNDNTITVTGPGVGVGGSTVWSLSLLSKANSGTFVISAEWTAGPLSDNPAAQAYLKSCKITPDPNASYGFGHPYFTANTLMAMEETAGGLAIQAYNGCDVSFTVTYSPVTS